MLSINDCCIVFLLHVKGLAYTMECVTDIRILHMTSVMCYDYEMRNLKFNREIYFLSRKNFSNYICLFRCLRT